MAARKLRSQGYRVIHRVSDGETVPMLREYSQAMGISGILIFSGDKTPGLTIVDAETGKKRKGSIEDIGLIKGKPFWKG